MSDWTFFSNYGHVLVCLARNSGVRLRDVALEVGITERAVQKIVRDMQDAGFLTVTKQGRCNRYRINKRKALRHSLESHCTVGKLIALIAGSSGPGISAKPSEESQAHLGTGGSGEETEPEVPAGPSKTERRAAVKEAAETEKEKKRASVDTREQGSLF